MIQKMYRQQIKEMRTLLHHEMNKGYIALISVILISAIGVAIMLSVIASGITAAKTDFSIQQGGAVRSITSSCVEEALQKIAETGTTSSNSSLAIASGTCIYLITSTNGQNITISATGNIGTITTKIKVIIATTTPAITLSSWEEIADF